MARHTTKWLVAGLVWAVNPTFGGCTGESFSFGEADMLALVQTLNDETWSDGDHDIDLELKQAADTETTSWRPARLSAGAAWACGNRSFAAEAAACLETSTLPVQGTVRVVDRATGETVAEGLAVTGEILVVGRDLDNAEAELAHDGGQFRLYSKDGAAFTLASASW